MRATKHVTIGATSVELTRLGLGTVAIAGLYVSGHAKLPIGGAVSSGRCNTAVG